MSQQLADDEACDTKRCHDVAQIRSSTFPAVFVSRRFVDVLNDRSRIPKIRFQWSDFVTDLNLNLHDHATPTISTGGVLSVLVTKGMNKFHTYSSHVQVFRQYELHWAKKTRPKCIQTWTRLAWRVDCKPRVAATAARGESLWGSWKNRFCGDPTSLARPITSRAAPSRNMARLNTILCHWRQLWRKTIDKPNGMGGTRRAHWLLLSRATCNQARSFTVSFDHIPYSFI
jgi:hypothetical protein